MATKVCDSCIDAFEDESFPMEQIYQGEFNNSVGVDLGYMMPDHLCDSIEANGDIFANAAGKVLYHCACSAHSC